jgi:hypothetical protein
MGGAREYPELSEDELLSAANDIFLEYDRRESEEWGIPLAAKFGSAISACRRRFGHAWYWAPIDDSDRALVTLVLHTTSERNTTFETALRTSFLKAGAFDAQGIVTVPVSRAIRMLGKLHQDQMRAVEAVVCRWLGLPYVPWAERELL